MAWLRIMLLGAILVPAAAFVLVAWWGLERAQAEATTAVSRASTLGFEHASNTFDIAIDIAVRAAQLTAGPDAEVRAHEAELHQRLADMLTGLPSIVNMNVWDAEGRALVRSDQLVDTKASIADRHYFQEQRDRPQPRGVSEVISGRQSGKELMNLTMRRPSADGSFRGIVAVSLSPSFFREYYQSLSAEDRRLASFALYRTDGELLARWPPPPDGQTRVQPSNTTLQRVTRGELSGTHTVSAQRGRETRFVSFRRLPQYPVYVVAGFSQAAMFADWVRFLALLAACIVPITAGLVCVTWVALAKTRLEHATSVKLRDEIRLRSVAERSMLEAQKLETLAVLTGGVAHDFNNLLTIADTSLHVQNRKHPEQAQEPQLLALSRAVRSGVRLTRQLLSFSRKQALRPETIRLQTWLPGAAELIRSSLVRSVKAEVMVDPDTLPITVDVAELELALINLALNARHAQPHGGSFRVVARNATPEETPDRPMVVIRADDEGVGIPAEILPRVIEPFFTTRERGAGSGLGLSQVHGFCTQAGGAFRIDSELGKGTSVRMSFPAAAESASAPENPPEPLSNVRLSGRLLLVEDNADVAESTRAMLSGSGLEVTLTRNAQEALEYLAACAEPPDVVLSDIAMPGELDGIGLAFRLRKERPGLRILLTTGYAEQIEKAISGGFEVLPKPTAPEELFRRLHEIAVEARRQRAEDLAEQGTRA